MYIPIIPASLADYAVASELASKFNLPFETQTLATTYLKVTKTKLALYDARFNPIVVDFINGKLGYRRQHGGGRDQALGRALSLKKGATPFVIDATAGLGKDAFVLTCLGCHVTMLERSPILSALLHMGLQQARQHSDTSQLLQNLHFVHTSAHIWLTQQRQQPDVIYLDPMYPPRHKSALVKKEMQLLKDIIGRDEDAPELLKVALEVATKRVVVKRPKQADYLGNMPPTTQIHSKNTRYDIYLP